MSHHRIRYSQVAYLSTFSVPVISLQRALSFTEIVDLYLATKGYIYGTDIHNIPLLAYVLRSFHTERYKCNSTMYTFSIIPAEQ